jgi:hypothetical protein
MSLTIFSEVEKEQERQKRLKREGKIRFTASDQKPTDAAKLTVLASQVGGASDAVLEKRGVLREELVKVAAVAVAWINAIDRAAETQIEAQAG